MNDKFFSAPVTLRVGRHRTRAVRSVWEAIECLHANWPVTGSQAYRAAVSACRDALDGWKSACAARRAFVAAARESRMLARGDPIHQANDSKKKAA
jgi:hypothetical protein